MGVGTNLSSGRSEAAMSWSVTLWLSVALTLATLTSSQYHRRQSPLGNVAAVDSGVLERFLLQLARVEAVKRGILQQLGLKEAPRPPPARNHSAAASVNDAEGRSVMAAYRRTVAQTRQHVVSNDVVSNDVVSNDVISNDVVDDVTGNDVRHGDAPSARQFYSFKGHATSGSRCDESGEHTLLFRVDIPEPTSRRIETVVTSATLKLFARRRRRNTSHRRSNSSPTDDIVVVTVYQLWNDNRRRHNANNETEVTSRAVRVVDDEAGATSWEEFDVTSAVKRHVTQAGTEGKVAGLLRLKVKVSGPADTSGRRLIFGEDWCDDVIVRELRHRHHPVLNVLTRDRPTRRRRTRRSVLPDVSVTSSTADEPLCTAGDAETRCCRRPLWISFREIGWDDWILAPDGYQAYYCYGACPPGHRTAHNHAAIRELVLSSTAGGGLPIPRPACTATRLGSLALAHYLNGRRVVSIFNDMIVEECRCA